MRIRSVFRKLLGFTQTIVTGVSFEEVGVVVDVRPRWRFPRCGECGRRAPGYDEGRPRVWRHLALGRMQFWLRYPPRRVNCGRCGVRVERVPWAAGPRARFTLELEELIAYLAQRMDKTAITKQLGVAWRSVGAVVQRIVAQRLDPTRLDELLIIGVDELSFRRNHNYVTVIVDHLRQRIVWVGEGRGAETLDRFFAELGAERASKLTHVTLDMSAAYIEAIDRHVPQAQKVFDRFHVQRLASDAVDQVRRAEVNQAEPEDRRSLKRSRWALLKNPWNLTQREGEKLSEVQRTNRRLYRAYLLKESLAWALDYRQRTRAERHLNGWIRWALRSRLKPFTRVANTIRRFKDGILAYVTTGLSNGPVEGLNNKTRLITRRAYGFHSAAALTALIHLCCGGIPLDPPLPRQPT